MNDKIKILPPLDESEHIKTAKLALKSLKEMLEFTIEYNQVEAKILKSKYDALIKEGFTEEQALELL